MFTQESIAELEAAGVQLHSTAKGIVEGRDSSDLINMLQLAQLTDKCRDEIKADPDKALGLLLGTALVSHGKS